VGLGLGELLGDPVGLVDGDGDGEPVGLVDGLGLGDPDGDGEGELLVPGVTSPVSVQSKPYVPSGFWVGLLHEIPGPGATTSVVVGVAHADEAPSAVSRTATATEPRRAQGLALFHALCKLVLVMSSIETHIACTRTFGCRR
jgi:hypothetical protein